MYLGKIGTENQPTSGSSLDVTGYHYAWGDTFYRTEMYLNDMGIIICLKCKVQELSGETGSHVAASSLRR